MPLQRNASSKVAVRHGHCKVYCSIDDVARVTSNLSFSQPVQAVSYQSGGGAYVYDTSSLICDLALGVQQRIAAKFSGVPIATLADGLRVVRRSGRNTGLDKAICKKLRSLNDAASFIRHFSPGYENGLYAALDEQLSKLDIDPGSPGLNGSLGEDSIDTLLPPPAPPPLEVPTAGPNPLEVELQQSQRLIDTQNSCIWSLSQHLNNSDTMLQSMITSAANARICESGIRESLDKVLSVARENESVSQSMLIDVHVKLDALGSQSSCVAVVPPDAQNIGVQTSIETSEIGVGATVPRWADTIDDSADLQHVRVQTEDLVDSEVSVSADSSADEGVDSEESTDSEDSSHFESDDVVDDIEEFSEELSDLDHPAVEQDPIIDQDPQHWLVGAHITLDFSNATEEVEVISCRNGDGNDFIFKVRNSAGVDADMTFEEIRRVMR